MFLQGAISFVGRPLRLGWPPEVVPRDLMEPWASRMSGWWSPNLSIRDNSLLIRWLNERSLHSGSMIHNFHFHKTFPGHDIGMEKRSKEMSNMLVAIIRFEATSQMLESTGDKPIAGNEIGDAPCFIR